MPRTVKIAVSFELFGLTSIESHLRQFEERSGFRCDFVGISNQDDVLRIKKDLKDCEIAFVTPHYIPKISECLPPSMKWIHTASAGVEQLNYLAADARDRLQRCTITRSATSYAAVMAEYTIYAILAMERNMSRIIWGQTDKNWHAVRSDVREFRSLKELSIGIIGVGEIGKEVARVCSCLGMTVHGMKRSLDPVAHVDKVYTSTQLTELLQACDYVCNILPSTSKTKGLLSNGVLKVCKNKPIRFINIGRGDIIEEKCLVEALNNGWIEKAFLDVFENEPLPVESPLWSFKNVTITPHVSGTCGRETVPAEFIKNLKFFINGQELDNAFKWDREY